MDTSHPTGSLTQAIYRMSWHRLDQSIQVGQTGRFWFFPSGRTATEASAASSVSSDGVVDIEAMPDAVPADAMKLIFMNGLLTADRPSEVRLARIVRITHPELGDLSRIDTGGMDYVILALDGREWIVNAEESPGTMYDEVESVADWRFHVTLADVSEPLHDAT